MLKVIVQLYPVIQARDEAEREALRPIGRNSERYQETLAGMNDIVKAADEMGVWGVSTIEHHFHSEGYEVGPNPGVLDAYWAAITKKVKIGQMGYVMSTANPIRVAEETAILDHLTKGRNFVGLARGYQSRWVNVLGQHLNTAATRSPTMFTRHDRAAISAEKLAQELNLDKTNRDIFERQVDLLLKAWTEPAIDCSTGPWQVPYPYQDGIDDWEMARRGTTGRLGAPGEADSQGVIRKVSVVPAPYTKPHPQVFVMSLGSPDSISYCGRMNFTAIYIANLQSAARGGQRYIDAALEQGRHVAFGQNQGVLRFTHFGKDMAEARDKVRLYDAEITKNFYSTFWPPSLETKADPVDNVLSTRTTTIGNIDEVRSQFVEQWKLLPSEYIVIIWHYAQQPKQSVIDEMELFMTKVKPALDPLTAYNEK